MRNIQTILIVFLFLSTSLQSQDVTVQSFNYDSETRDTMLAFPDVDHNNWEKIIMLYSMRCKDGNVSPPIQGQTNIGCGEWDYSCNTYITDSMQVDSQFQISPDFTISNFSGDEFDYSIAPTYTYYSSTYKQVEVNAINAEIEYGVSANDSSTDVFSGNANDQKKLSFYWRNEDLMQAGIPVGGISALDFDVMNGSGDFNNFKIRMRHSSVDETCFLNTDWTEVFYDNLSLDATNSKVVFYEDFNWNGADHIEVEVSFRINNSDLITFAEANQEGRLISSTNNGISNINGSGHLKIAGDFSAISNEVTVSFWSKGSDALPVNTYFIEGFDVARDRQLNVHLPWSNGRVYWDCGNDGSGYDRIDKAASAAEYKSNWVHWTFTKNTNTGSMRIYLNGALWHTGTGKTNPISIDTLVIGASKNGTGTFLGDIDDVKLWSKELSMAEIEQNWCGDTEMTDGDLVLHYDFNDIENGLMKDQSSNNLDAEIIGSLRVNTEFAREFKSYQNLENLTPTVSVIQGDYDLTVSNFMSLDSVQNGLHVVNQFELDGTDRIIGSTNNYYPAGDMPIYDEEGNLIGSKFVNPDGTIVIGSMEHYSKSPMQMEIMSFVTPYGINLDLGIEGKTWTFDVTDFAPILKGNKRMFLSRGGQWQEDMDIKFLFYEGTPARNVHSIQQIWPVTQSGFTAIEANTRYEPRALVKTAEDDKALIKTVVTGHGQEGEFIPRQHYLSIDGNALQWSVWKECADNPIWPQGGTWHIDRAGWCPGAPSDQRIHDFTEIMENDVPAMIDYGVNNAAGDSRYIVSSQFVRYGAPNFQFDASVKDIVYPSNKIEYGKFNPNCGNAKIIIENRGSERLTNAMIYYGIEGGPEYQQEFQGSLRFLETAEVNLSFIPLLASSAQEETFYARVEMGNDSDEYQSNDEYKTTYTPVDMLDPTVVIILRTNNYQSQTSYKVYNEFDEEIFHKSAVGLTANTTYYDTLANLNGCYRLEILDSGQDGLDYWANPNQGTGYLRIGFMGQFHTVNPDFGSFIEYNFVAGMVSSTEEELEQEVVVNLFPNPVKDVVHILVEGMNNGRRIDVYNNQGQLVKSRILNRNAIINEEISTSDLMPGMYLIHVIGEGGTVVRKMIKS